MFDIEYEVQGQTLLEFNDDIWCSPPEFSVCIPSNVISLSCHSCLVLYCTYSPILYYHSVASNDKLCVTTSEYGCQSSVMPNQFFFVFVVS